MSEEKSKELEPLNIECLQVLLQKLIKDDDFKKVGDVLKDEDLISQGQKKTFQEKKDFDTAFTYLIAALKRKEELTYDNLQSTFQSKEFPADNQARRLLSYIVGGTDKDLLFVVKNWDFFVCFQDKLKPLVPNLSDDEDWIKALMFAAFHEVTTGSVEKTVLNAMKQELAKIVAAEGFMQDDGDKMQVETKATEGAGNAGNLDAKRDESDKNSKIHDSTTTGSRYSGSSLTAGKDDGKASAKQEYKHEGTGKSEKSPINNADKTSNVTARSMDSKNQSSSSKIGAERGTKNENRGTNGSYERAEKPKQSAVTQEPVRVTMLQSSAHRESEDRWLKITFLSPDILPTLSKDEHLLEIRAVVSDLTALPQGVPLCMISEDTDWKPIEMAFNKKKEFYFLRVLCHARHDSKFRFKFCCKPEKNRIAYEVLPGDLHGKVNRLINLKEASGRWETILNVCLFQRVSTWAAMCCDAMQKFLPSADEIRVESELHETSILHELLAWVNVMEDGWKDDSLYSSPSKAMKRDWENILLNWLNKIIEKLSGNNANSIFAVLPALYLTIAFQVERHKFIRPKLFFTLLKALRIDSLNQKDCKQLYRISEKALQNATQNRYIPLSFREPMHWLYQQIPEHQILDNPNLDWIFTVPLYWLLAHGEVKTSVLKEDSRRKLLFARSSLPSANQLDWGLVYRKCAATAGVRKEMLWFSSEVLKLSKLHPWIVRTYQFMLKAREFAELVCKSDEIALQFPVDSAIFQYVDGIIERRLLFMSTEQNKAFEKYFRSLLDKAVNSSSARNVPKSKVDFDIQSCLNILDTIKRFVKPDKYKDVEAKDVIWSIDVVLMKTVSWVAVLHVPQEHMKKISEKLKTFLDCVTIGISKKTVKKEEVKYWGRLLNFKWDLEEFDKIWKKLIIHEIQNLINNFCNLRAKKEQFLEFYLNELGDLTLQPEIEKCMSEKAYQITESILEESQNRSRGWRELGSRFKSWVVGSRPRIIPIVEKLFEKEYKNVKSKGNSDKTTALQFLCNWGFSVQFYDLFGGEQLDNFLPGPKKLINQVSHSFKEVVKSLTGAHVTVEHLQIILKNKDRFLLLWRVLKVNDKESSSVDDIRNAVADQIAVCEKYFEVFEKTKTAVKSFTSVCNLMDFDDPVPHASFERKLRIDTKRKEVCDLVTKDAEENLSATKIFGITDEQLQEFQQLHAIKESRKLFPNMLMAAVNEIRSQSNEQITWEDIVKAWTSVKKQMLDLVKEVDSGTITMDVVSNQFAVLEGCKESIDWEIDLLYNFCQKYDEADPAVVLENHKVRKLQIFNIFEVQQANRNIEVLLKLKDLLNLQGDFETIVKQKQMLENQVDFHLFEMPEELKMSAVTSITAEKLKVLEKFIDGERIIVWLRDKMEGMNEVKVMCDLATITAGEDAVELGKVSCLLSAVMGFAPLIFWNEVKKGDEEINEEKAGSSKTMKKSKNGLRELLSRCKKVWTNATENVNLLDEWEETNHQLNWFQDVEKFYGSVEKSSMTRAQEINKQGVYSISKKHGELKPTLENSMKLTIPDSNQVFSLETLRELQSKLMLIAGEADKGQRDVNQFIDVLSSVEKLAEIYVKLQSSGCMLFSGWEATIGCHGNHESITENLAIQIAFTNDAPPLRGQGFHTDLDKITEILEQSLKKWEDHVSEERMRHYYLNEFDIEQIIYLCHELSAFEDTEEMSDQVYTLLSFVREDFTEDDLRQALEHAKRDIIFGSDEDSDNEILSGDDGDTEDEEGEELDNNAREARKSFAAVQTLMTEDGVPEDHAKATVQANGYQDMEECRIWLLENPFEEDLIDELSAAFDENYEQYSGRKKAEVVHSVFKENCNNTLSGVISRLLRKIAQREDTQGTLLDSMVTICEGYLDETITMNLQDHLSIGLLGQTLMNLSENSAIHRDMLPGLHCGKPNVLVCGEEEMLPTVLSLFMHSHAQRLPSRSEVLICSDETTKDEVERFIRRALLTCPTQGQRLYTLANADKLNYPNSVAVVDIFNKCSKSNRMNAKYQLVFLLSKQQHYLATYFYKHVVDGQWARKTAEISKYLAEQLKVTELANSAASAVRGQWMVKVVTSTRSGVGKSLYVQRVRELLSVRNDFDTRNVTIRLMENKIDLDYIIRKLCPSERIHNNDTIMAHVDMTPAVQRGIESFIFDLFVLGSIQGSDGKVWKRHTNHLYLVEMTDFGATGEKRFSNRHILNLLPCVRCYPPQDVLKSGERNLTGEWLGMDRIEFQSEKFQRPYQYLLKYEKEEDLDQFSYRQVQGEENECIAVLLRHCCIKNPSWAQLRHFCSFLNFQLGNCENSVFCNIPDIKQVLVGLKAFAVGFMIKMAQDFATPSLTISDTSTKDAEDNKEFQAHQVRRKWEESFHPYVFFNEDGQTMTFVNVKIDRQGNLLGKNDEIMQKIITPELTTALHQQGFQLRKNFDDYSRAEKLGFLCQVLGIDDPFDPDPTYELTTDNVLKILAIYTRFQCGIPVIIMGETGCGKTRLVEFMSKLKAGRIAAPKDKLLENMTTLKIHGGITVCDIHRSVEAAKIMERHQRNQRAHKNFAVLFCDEANTTEAIYAIKEVMCDRSIDGEFFHDSNLKIVAACNPYKKLSKAAIAKLEDSGLGYRIRTSKTAHLFGNIPVRSLVYRVVALPPSMQPFVWDFGQLNDEAERIYIQQMTKKLAQKLGLNEAQNTLINNVLSHCQQYMRKRTDECRYVSLRDVERCMITFEWFYNKRSIILPMITDEINKKNLKLGELKIGEVVRVLIQTVAVCYHASLDEREPFRRELARCLNQPGVDEERINTEIIFCQSAFLRNVRVGQNIARNQALRENVFMMAVCTDMRIPLFLVGKPGSSKSLAKTIVTNNMQGQTSHANLYKKLKQIHILSYQCSALTDADGIKKVFNQCVQLQKKQNLENYTAVVVLDEIGLAEDSPNMPLKILHPLLERRSTDLTSVNQDDAERVGFIGISNWALDPAKMNRGIFLTRNRPEEKDLRKTGKEIFQGRSALWKNNEDLLNELTQTYVEMYNSQRVEYFGLRDYYSLMKMICIRCQNADEDIDLQDVIYAISRNFGGGDEAVIDKFVTRASNSLQDNTGLADTSIPIQRMIQDNLSETESRFLLLLANQFSIVSLLESCIENFAEGYQVVFGSSFPGDHSYTEICRNINKIKVCMETGTTVILLNMAKIHESLYDALNQHFVTMGKQNFVDLGLGGHRVKCRISTDFRLIVIEKNEVVRREYPIPLINRLEKHHFKSERLLDDQKKIQSQELREWALKFTSSQSCFTCQHAFIGYHDDTPGSVIFTSVNDEMEQYKKTLLQACPMDAIFRLRDSRLTEEEKGNLQDVYFNEQQHDGLVDVLKEITKQENHFSVLEVTSFSGVLWDKDVEELEGILQLKKKSITLLPLEQFQTQQEYCNRLDKFFEKCRKQRNTKSPLILLVQCAQAQLHSTLIACARFSLMNKIRDFRGNLNADEETNITIALLLSTEREGLNEENSDSLNLQHTSETLILHVDELQPTDEQISPASNFFNKSLKEIFEDGKERLENDAEQMVSLVKIKTLLLDSVTECMTKVKYSGNNEKNLERIKILRNLCSMDDGIGKHFCKIALSKIIEAFDVIGDRYGEGMDWIVERANDGESLQDAGTFRKALWLCLKGHLSRFLAFLISKIDRNSNLDIISKDKPDPWEIEMWFGMFQRFDIPWAEMLDKPPYIVGGSRMTIESCDIPFSFGIIDYLESQWKALESQNLDLQDRTIYRIFREFKMRGILSRSMTQKKAAFMKKFVSDIVKNLYRPGTDKVEETQLVTEVIFDFAMKNFQQSRKQDNFEDGDEVVVMYTTFKKFSGKLEILSEVLRRCPEILLKNQKKWITKQAKEKDLALHVLAFKDTLALLKQMAEKIQDPRICVDWIDLAREVKKLYSFVISDVKDEETLKEINKDWNPLRLLDLLLLQLLPPAHVDNVLFKRFVKTIAPQAKLFWRGTARADPRSQSFMRIVLNVLKKCSNDIELQLLLNWKEPKCKLCGKIPKQPTFLPCRHFGCINCILRHLLPDQNGKVKCPICNVEIPDGFTPSPKVLDEDRLKISNQTKFNCTSFFLEYLQQFCFSLDEGNISLQMEPQVKRIMKYLIVEDRDERPELDPSGLDMNINFKSCVLQLLLDFNQNLVEAEINRYLQDSEGEIHQSLLIVIIKTLLRKVSTKSARLNHDFGKMTRFWEATLRQSWRTLTEDDAEMNLKTIQNVVEVRNALCHFADIMEVIMNEKKQNKNTQQQLKQFTDLAMVILRRSSNATKEFVLKCGNKKYGLQWLKQLSNHDEFTMIIPPYLKQAIADRSADFWVLLGRQYVETKSRIYQNDPDDYETEAAAIFDQYQGENPLPHVLAVMSWAKGKDLEVQQKLAGVLQHKCGNFVSYLNLLIHGDQTLLGIIERHVAHQHVNALFQTVVMILATLTTSQNNILQGFKQIIQNVQTAQGLFLPTMQQHWFFSVPTEFKDKNQRVEFTSATSMYTCPKGHPYFVGECNQPMQEASCPDCKSTIGGRNHAAASGNQKFAITAQSQSGYKRNTEDRNYSTGVERMTLQGHAAVQLMLHTSLLAGSLNNPGAVAGFLGVGGHEKAQRFLVQQLQQNMEDLAKGLAKNIDDAAYIMIRVLLRMLQMGQANHTQNWSSMDNRKDWEQTFRKDYLLPIFQNIDNELTAAAQAAAQESEVLTGALLTRMLQDIPPPTEDGNVAQRQLWQRPSLWMIVEHKAATHLMQKLENSADESTGQVLKIIMKSRNLEYLKHLESILTLQQKLVEIYQYKLDLGEADQVTLRNHIEREDVGDEEFIKKYIIAWDELHTTLKGVAPDFLHEYFEPLTLDSPLSMALPSVRGRGQCAKLLAEYLIETQNNFLNECISVIKPHQELKEVEIQQMTSSDFLCIDKEKDFIEMIDMHTSYRICTDREKGRQHFTDYNFEALEKQVREKYVLCKRAIKKNTLMFMRYVQDVGITDDWKKVESTIQQEPLTAKLCQDIDGAVEKSHSADVCERVRVLSSAIRFLAMVKTEPTKLLHEFLQNDLKLPTARTTIIPRSALIVHVLAIYQRLTWHKAIIFIQRNLDPYKEALRTITQEDIPPEILSKKKEFFDQIDIPQLQQKMNEMLITGIGIDNANWSLVEDVFPALDYDGDESWYGMLPKELCNKHISHLFKETVKFKRGKD